MPHVIQRIMAGVAPMYPSAWSHRVAFYVRLVGTIMIVMVRQASASVGAVKCVPWAPIKAAMGIPPSVPAGLTEIPVWAVGVILIVPIQQRDNVSMMPVYRVI